MIAYTCQVLLLSVHDRSSLCVFPHLILITTMISVISFRFQGSLNELSKVIL